MRGNKLLSLPKHKDSYKNKVSAKTNLKKQRNYSQNKTYSDNFPFQYTQSGATRFLSQPSFSAYRQTSTRTAQIKEQLFHALSSINKEINVKIDSKERFKVPLRIEGFINQPVGMIQNDALINRKNSKLLELNDNFMKGVASLSHSNFKTDKNKTTETPSTTKELRRKSSKSLETLQVKEGFIPYMIPEEGILMKYPSKEKENILNTLQTKNYIQYTREGFNSLRIQSMNVKEIMSFFEKQFFKINLLKKENNDLDKNLKENKKILSSRKEEFFPSDDNRKFSGEYSSKGSNLAEVSNELNLAIDLIEEENLKLQEEILERKKENEEILKKYKLDLEQYDNNLKEFVQKMCDEAERSQVEQKKRELSIDFHSKSNLRTPTPTKSPGKSPTESKEREGMLKPEIFLRQKVSKASPKIEMIRPSRTNKATPKVTNEPKERVKKYSPQMSNNRSFQGSKYKK